MRKVLSVLILAISISHLAHAEDSKKPSMQEKFQKKKARILENIAKRMQALQSHQSCINSATDKDGLQKCMASQKEMMMKHKEERANRKANRKTRK